jgi:hypothetical protein
MEQNNETNTQKKLFEELENKGRTFEDESNEFAGDDVTVNYNIFLSFYLVEFFNKK